MIDFYYSIGVMQENKRVFLISEHKATFTTMSKLRTLSREETRRDVTSQDAVSYTHLTLPTNREV